MNKKVSSFLFSCISFKYVSLLSFISVFNLTVDVSSVVGAPWRCGVLATLGGIAGIGLGRLLGREHASTPQSGVELLACQNGASPDCCCCVVVVVVVVVVVLLLLFSDI